MGIFSEKTVVILIKLSILTQTKFRLKLQIVSLN